MVLSVEDMTNKIEETCLDVEQDLKPISIPCKADCISVDFVFESQGFVSFSQMSEIKETLKNYLVEHDIDSDYKPFIWFDREPKHSENVEGIFSYHKLCVGFFQTENRSFTPKGCD